MMEESNKGKVASAARDLIKIEKKCFYGQEQERDRLRKMRELIDKVTKEMSNDN
ncbi:hypothetical protein [Halomonas alimentaria]|uniref:Uncharacterized protein n=1 Tax=Halomonas alimentaria TaxID=147248 RepID=A0A7X4W3E6_9GAMM|nr:hypothetical protein [Halomonas alimentaria]NAW33495.1 hypothetical protein [Halomonas alimentaria]